VEVLADFFSRGLKDVPMVLPLSRSRPPRGCGALADSQGAATIAVALRSFQVQQKAQFPSLAVIQATPSGGPFLVLSP
jgi:hypothetical protein